MVKCDTYAFQNEKAAREKKKKKENVMCVVFLLLSSKKKKKEKILHTLHLHCCCFCYCYYFCLISHSLNNNLKNVRTLKMTCTMCFTHKWMIKQMKRHEKNARIE